MALIESLGMAAGQSVLNGLSNWLQGHENVERSKELMDYQSKKELETQSMLNARLYPQQVASMRMAGLNPAMMSGPMSQGASTPSATQNMPAVTLDLIDAATAMSSIELNKAQAKDLEASANLKNEEAGMQSMKNLAFPEEWQIQMNTIIKQGNKASADAALAEESINQVKAATERINQEVEQLKASIDQLSAETAGIKERNKWITPQAKAEIFEINSRARLLVGENQRENDKIWKTLRNMDTENSYMNTMININRVVEDAQKLSLKIQRETGRAGAWLDLFGKGVGIVTQGVSMFAPIPKVGTSLFGLGKSLYY